MKRKVVEWTIGEIYRKRDRIGFPEFQREPRLWSLKDKQLLIDSVLQDIDIPKLYFHETENHTYEVVDGQQRLWALWEFIDGEYSYRLNSSDQKFQELTEDVRRKILSYPLQITLLGDVSDEYLRKSFLRLQLGLLLVTGEKLHATTGLIRDFVFKTMMKHPFIRRIRIPERRYAKETLCAQICINSFSRKNINEFSRTRFEDLESFFETFKRVRESDLREFDKKCKRIISTLDVLGDSFGKRADELKNRSFILSLYLFAEEMCEQFHGNELREKMIDFVKFSLELLKRLRSEAKLGFRRKNEDLYVFESYLSNAPGEKYQIKRRHEKLKEFFEWFQKTKKIKGDR